MKLKNIVKKSVLFCIPYGIVWIWRKNPIGIFKRMLKIRSNKKLIVFSCSHERFGNEYGGFDVCLDLLNSKRNEKITVYSFGIGCDISFDLEMLTRYENVDVFAFDPTPISIDWVNKQQLPENFHFTPTGVSDRSGKEKMHLPKEHGVSFTVCNLESSDGNSIEVDMETIGEIMKQNKHEFVDVLKFDVEGSEFAILKALKFFDENQNGGVAGTSERKHLFGQLLIEFHERFIKNGQKELSNVIELLKQNGYHCFAATDYEYSFLNKDLYDKMLADKQ